MLLRKVSSFEFEDEKWKSGDFIEDGESGLGKESVIETAQWTLGIASFSIGNTLGSMIDDGVHVHVYSDGDLVGFQFAWGLVSIVFLGLKIGGIGNFKDKVSWTSIFMVPICNTVFTGVFDGIIKHYHDANSIESLLKRRFYVPLSPLDSLLKTSKLMTKMEGGRT